MEHIDRQPTCNKSLINYVDVFIYIREKTEYLITKEHIAPSVPDSHKCNSIVQHFQISSGR